MVSKPRHVADATMVGSAFPRAAAVCLGSMEGAVRRRVCDLEGMGLRDTSLALKDTIIEECFIVIVSRNIKRHNGRGFLYK